MSDSNAELTVQERIVNIIRKDFVTSAHRDSIEDSTHLVNDLGLDSLDVIELAMALEEEFDIAIPDEEMARIATVGDFVRAVKKRSK